MISTRSDSRSDLLTYLKKSLDKLVFELFWPQHHIFCYIQLDLHWFAWICIGLCITAQICIYLQRSDHSIDLHWCILIYIDLYTSAFYSFHSNQPRSLACMYTVHLMCTQQLLIESVSTQYIFYHNYEICMDLYRQTWIWTTF